MLVVMISVLNNVALNYCRGGKLEQAIETYDRVLKMETTVWSSTCSPSQLLRLSTCMSASIQSRVMFELFC